MTDLTPPARRRLPREARTRQLLETSWTLIADEGTDALTLGRLADAAGVTKPVVYDHFGSREGLLAAMYEDYDVRQTALFDSAIAAAQPTLPDKAAVFASAYVDCVMTQGREIQGVLAALSGSPQLAAVKRKYQTALLQKCAGIFAPFAVTGGVSEAGLWVVLGAADAVSEAAVSGEITADQAKEALHHTVIEVVQRTR
ncbi:TetR/AcrR family transcriptional regulator [Pseudomonas sp. S60]|uniref:TetR/AcrR family transcriptional regulator n=1 Tax=Pseudomonas sp. S60 TaxID=211124 RepID=UPI001913E337|nr:TetR/AcrR family transcriptional regulator [Pseudomonas sp. S60]MBK5012930.1 TetR/AcrR family transcriptional regulator [Pseudomonas sp. S60]